MAHRTITKRQLCERIAKKTGYTQVVTKEIIQLFLDEIIEELGRGHRMEFRDFGVFDTRLQMPRKARNPRTDEEVHVSAKVAVRFKVGKKMGDLAQSALEMVRKE
ncbi:MAG: HU family DNA-binding protein [Planctomycetes bacterium]|nr:HU family DNA-binding protein [Planctomycetota bacterium]